MAVFDLLLSLFKKLAFSFLIVLGLSLNGLAIYLLYLVYTHYGLAWVFLPVICFFNTLYLNGSMFVAVMIDRIKT